VTAFTDPAQLVDVMGIPFSDEQLEAITADLGPQVIIAGAGTGKTTVMAARVVWLVGTSQVDPHHIVGLTFTNKAAGELSLRITKALERLDSGGEGQRPTVATYDSFAASVMSEFGSWLGIGPSSRIITKAEAAMLAEEVLVTTDHLTSRLAQASWGNIVEAIVDGEANIQAHLVSDQRILDHGQQLLADLSHAPRNRQGNVFPEIRAAIEIAQERIELLHLCQRFRQLKRERHVMEFADQMAQAVEVVESFPLIGEILRDRYQVVVVDEYQDTSPAQIALLSGLYGASAGRENYPITAVGDPLQAIYTWRAAAADSIYSFPEVFRRETPMCHTLTINRRSGEEILHVANAISTKLREDPLLAAQAPPLLRTDGGDKSAEVELYEFPAWDDELDWLVSAIDQSHTQDQQDYDQIAVLVRQRKHIPAIVAACSRAGIPVSSPRVSTLVGVEPISHVLAMMELLVDEDDHRCAVEILAGSRFGVDEVDLELLYHRTRSSPTSSQGRTVTEVLKDPGLGYSDHGRHAYQRLGADLELLSHHSGGVLDHVLWIIETIGLDQEMRSSFKDSYGYYQQFLSLVADFSVNYPSAKLGGLLAYLHSEDRYSTSTLSSPGEGHEAVHVMTIHQAKGLEWNHVYLPAMVSGVFPYDRVRDNPLTTASALPSILRCDANAVPQLTEVTKPGLVTYRDALKESLLLSEDRLAYVGITRARTKVVLSGHHRYPGLVNPRQRSPYMDIIEATLPIAITQMGEQDAPSDPAHLEAYPWRVPGHIDWHEAARAIHQIQINEQDTNTNWGESVLPGEALQELARWDEAIDRMITQSQCDLSIDVRLPAPLSASQLVRLEQDPDQFLAELVRPMPQAPSRQTRTGSTFHDWVEQYYRAAGHGGGATITDEPSIEDLCRKFRSSVFAQARPQALEEAIITTIAGHAISGRIDAVFDLEDNPQLCAEKLIPPGKKILIIDWKTGSARADERQLAIYSRAIAQVREVDPQDIIAGFYYVKDSRLAIVPPDDSSLDGLLTSVELV